MKCDICYEKEVTYSAFKRGVLLYLCAPCSDKIDKSYSVNELSEEHKIKANS